MVENEQGNGKEQAASEKEQESSEQQGKSPLSAVQLDIIYKSFKPEIQAFIDLEAGGKLSKTEIARRIGVSRRTLNNYCLKRGVFELIDARRVGSEDSHLSVIEKMVDDAHNTGVLPSETSLDELLREIQGIQAVSMATRQQATALKCVELRAKMLGLLDTDDKGANVAALQLNLSMGDKTVSISAMSTTAQLEPNEET